MMKTILLFSRNDLVNLYGGLAKRLKNEFRFVHLAYSHVERRILNEKYGITDVVVFKDEIDKLFHFIKYDPALDTIIDQEVIKHTGQSFNLNAVVQSDRTFAYLKYDECLHLIQVYYTFWNQMVTRFSFDFMVHEPVALSFLQLAHVVLLKHDILYLTQINVFGEHKYNWIFVSAHKGFLVELPEKLAAENTEEADLSKASKFLNEFRSNYQLIFPNIVSKTKSKNHFSYLKQSITAILRILKRRTVYKPDLPASSIDHVELYGHKSGSGLVDTLKNIYDYTYKVRYDSFDRSLNYFYYPMHMEPEAVVLYWGDGLYKNQIKLIENIASQLPPHYYLFVKSHPIVKEPVLYIDIKRIKAIPNVKFLDPDVSGRMIIAYSKGVMTINGTSGFEGVLLNKPVFVFGNSFYDLAETVIKVKNIRDLRELVYAAIAIKADETRLLKFIVAYLRSTKPGFVSYYLDYFDRIGLEHEDNIDEVSRGFQCLITLRS